MRMRGLVFIACMALSLVAGCLADDAPENAEQAVAMEEIGEAAFALQAVSVTESAAAGVAHSLGLRSDGTVWAWGSNSHGQLGTSGITASSTPSQVDGLPAIRAIAAGGQHSLALDMDGRVWTWGRNDSGQLGRTTNMPATPNFITIPGGGAIAIAAGLSHSLALSADGTVYAWGANTYGQIGNGTTGNAVVNPVAVTIPGGATMISAGWYFSLAVNESGAVHGWGQNTSGQLGDGTTTNRPAPVPSGISSNATAISGGGAHTLALVGGSVWAWGQNTSGQLGNGTMTTGASVPIQISLAGNAVAIAAGGYHSLAILDNGTVMGWGRNSFGQIGDGSTTTRTSPVVAQTLDDARVISAGQSHSLVVRTACPFWAWGYNANGQIGDGTTTNRAAPVQSTVFRVLCFDGDLDGFGDPMMTTEACAPDLDWVLDCSDCEDFDPWIFPGNPETCDGIDNNCSGAVDEDNPEGGAPCDSGEPGVCSAGTITCEGGMLICVSDDVPSQEQCNGLDDDCDGEADDGNPGGTLACNTGQQGVCADGVTFCCDGMIECAPLYSPSPEVCDSLDNDCDGTVEEGLTFTTYYRDADADGYGNTSQSVSVCLQPMNYVPQAGDCNDSNGSIRPGATEVCDGVDNDCDGQTDEGVKTTYYRDADGDTYGNLSQTIQACSRPIGYAYQAGDCNDNNSSIRPGATEVCDGVDNDCDAQIDEGVKSTYYRDVDGDGYGISTQTTLACSRPSGYAAQAGDCNDSNSSIRPGATEICDSIDNDCDAQIDEGVKTTYYRDADNDTYGTSQTTQACSQPIGYATRSGDCNDSNSSIRPGATEICDEGDNDCDGVNNEGGVCGYCGDGECNSLTEDPTSCREDCCGLIGGVIYPC